MNSIIDINKRTRFLLRSSKPYPYGSECRGGRCVPYNPNTEENEIPGAETETGAGAGAEGGGGAQPVVESAPAPAQAEAEMNGIDDTPAWYDPIYNR